MKEPENLVRIDSYKERYKDYVGQKFGKLTVMDFPGFMPRADHNGLGRAAVQVKCDCGKEFITTFTPVKNGHTKSCGCIHSKYKEGDLGAFSNLMSHTKSSASQRNIKFELNFEDFLKLSKSNCFYCGVKPSQVKNYKRGSVNTITHNGIDRVDSNKDYTIDNVVPCCKTCNFAKNSLHMEEFQEWINRMGEFRSKKNQEQLIEI